MTKGDEKRSVGIKIDQEAGIATLTIGEDVHVVRLDDALGGELRVPTGSGGGNKSEAGKAAGIGGKGTVSFQDFKKGDGGS